MLLILMLIIGTGLSSAASGLLNNNTIIVADSNGVIDDLHCSSDTTTANVGHWISSNGVDVTSSAIYPFEVTVGDEQDPGSLLIHQRNGHIVTRSFQGVYTCLIRDQNQVQQYIYVGIYQNGFTSM